MENSTLLNTKDVKLKEGLVICMKGVIHDTYCIPAVEINRKWH